MKNKQTYKQTRYIIILTYSIYYCCLMWMMGCEFKGCNNKVIRADAQLKKIKKLHDILTKHKKETNNKTDDDWKQKIN